MWRDWFIFSRQDRRAILLLSALIVIVVVLYRGKWNRHPDDVVIISTDSVVACLSSSASQSPIVAITPHAFNPNTADSLELISVGFPSYVARNIIRYRMAGGMFRKPDDLARIYGLHDTVFSRIKPYIVIPSANPIRETKLKSEFADTDTVMPDFEPEIKQHPYAEYMRAKLKPGQFVDVNQADTSELMKIPGIGPVYAKMIVDYRERLGGFHSVAQLYELHKLPEGLADWVYVNDIPINKINVNKLSVTQLNSHPYLSFYQAKAIVDFRKREGDIKSVRQLQFMKEFSKADIERLTPYLSFD